MFDHSLGRNNFRTAGVLALLPTLKRLNKLRVIKWVNCTITSGGASMWKIERGAEVQDRAI